MGNSNSEWGTLAEADDSLAQLWDSYRFLPDPGQHVALDALCESKRIDVRSLTRLGCRLAQDDVLAFAFAGGIKYRRITDGRRWASADATFPFLKIVPAQQQVDTRYILIAEGETDAARLTMLYPWCDVAIMPAGARRWTDAYTTQVEKYDGIFVCLDNDEAGEAGYEKIKEATRGRALRWRPPAKDWCETADADVPALPDPESLPTAVSSYVVLREYLELEAPDVVSWFEQAVLPVAGLAILHGWAKSYKTWLSLDMMASLATGRSWATFDPTEEPAKVMIVQYEITLPYFQERLTQLRMLSPEPQLLDENLYVYSPVTRPPLLTDKTGKHADDLLSALSESGASIVLIDPIRRATGAIDMNSEQEVRAMLAVFERLQNEGITVVATHHDNKEGSKAGGGDPLNMTGSGAWAGDPDTLVSVSLPHKTTLDSPRRNLHFTLRNGPAPGFRGFEMQHDGRLVYADTAWDSGDQEDSDEAPGI